MPRTAFLQFPCAEGPGILSDFVFSPHRNWVTPLSREKKHSGCQCRFEQPWEWKISFNWDLIGDVGSEAGLEQPHERALGVWPSWDICEHKRCWFPSRAPINGAQRSRRKTPTWSWALKCFCVNKSRGRAGRGFPASLLPLLSCYTAAVSPSVKCGVFSFCFGLVFCLVYF